MTDFSDIANTPAAFQDFGLNEEARLLYVAMTRAQEYLLLTASADNHYVQRLVAK
ncbi:MAG TPA: 3'-5' exonuclease [Cellvibrio sp.]|nr:3'-5' exonuclease [Cellvibrio sp.]